MKETRGGGGKGGGGKRHPSLCHTIFIHYLFKALSMLLFVCFVFVLVDQSEEPFLRSNSTQDTLIITNF